MGSVPRSHRYYGTLRLPAIHPGGLVDSPAGTVLVPLTLLPPSAGTAHDGPGFWSAGSPTGISRTEMTGSPEFPSDPLDACPAPIRPRRDRSARPFDARDVAFRSAAAVTRTPRKTRFRAVANLTRAGLDPQDLFERFPSDSSHAFSSPFPELCSAHAKFTSSQLRAREWSNHGH
jgi:hypothetical protein